ncbi:MAG TPA: SDR family oxidoreductase [Terracidiphilus sp.]
MTIPRDLQTPELVIVTGAGRGIGRNIALTMGNLGAEILCVSQSERARHTAETIVANGGVADWLSVDLSDCNKAEASVSQWLGGKSFSRIGLALAAGTLGPAGPLSSSSLSSWDLVFRTNVLGNLAVTKAALPAMQNGRYGRMAFFAGGGAAYAYPVFPAYAASKAALVRVVENLHEDLKDRGDFAVVILAPGAVETDTLAEVKRNGGYVRTTVSIDEPVEFVKQFLCARHCSFSGCFVHVRDIWQTFLNSDEQLCSKDLWMLRRVE